MSTQPHNTDRYHCMSNTELQSAVYRLDTLNLELLAALENARVALRKWEGANDRRNYADKFVWEAWDTILATLEQNRRCGHEDCGGLL